MSSVGDGDRASVGVVDAYIVTRRIFKTIGVTNMTCHGGDRFTEEHEAGGGNRVCVKVDFV